MPVNKTVLPITVDDELFVVIMQVPKGFIWEIADNTGKPIPNHPWRDPHTKRFMGHDVPMTTHTFEGIVDHVSEMLNAPAADVSFLLVKWLANDDGVEI